MAHGRQIDSLPHDACGSKDALKVFLQDDGTVDGYCFRCGPKKGFVRHPYGKEVDKDNLPNKTFKIKTPEEIANEIAEIGGYKTVDVVQRRLRADTLEHFGAKVSVSEQDGVTPTAIYWPVTKNEKITGYHVKIVNPVAGMSKAYNLGDVKDCNLLGWDVAKKSGAHTLVITEGPEDMASVYKIYDMYTKDENKQWMPAVVSLPQGASSAKHYIQKHAGDIKKLFKKVILSFDDDQAGQQAVKDVHLILPDSLTVTLPYKDANECLLEGAAKAAYSALSFTAHSPKNTSLVFAPSLHMLAREPAKYGELTWPFPTLNDLTRGIRYGETIYVGAGVKMGKTELRDEIAAHFIREHNSKVFMASFEEATRKTYKKLVGKMSSRTFHDPKKEFDYEAFDRGGEAVENNLALLDVYQRADKDMFLADLVAAAEWGAKSAFVDPITNFTNGIGAGEANTVLQGMAQELAYAARDLDMTIFIFCHLKEPEGNLSKDSRKNSYDNGKYIGLGNCPHEYGGDVMSAQFAGSRAMMRSCNYMLGIEGNKDPEIPDEFRNIRNIKLLEDREFGETGIVPVYWNRDTGRFKEM